MAEDNTDKEYTTIISEMFPFKSFTLLRPDYEFRLAIDEQLVLSYEALMRHEKRMELLEFRDVVTRIINCKNKDEYRKQKEKEKKILQHMNKNKVVTIINHYTGPDCEVTPPLRKRINPRFL